MNRTSIPPMNTMNRMYWNQNLLYISPLIRHVIIVCINSITPMASGWFICVNITPDSVLAVINILISGGSLF
jgi:hypothetical protein